MSRDADTNDLELGDGMKRRTVSVALLVLFGLVLLISYRVYRFQCFKTRVQEYIVTEIVRLQREFDYDVPGTYLIAHRQRQPVKLGSLLLWNYDYFAGWQYDNGTLVQLSEAEWWVEARKDLTTLSIFSVRPLDESRLYVPIDFVLPKRFSLDGNTNRATGTLWILDYGDSDWQFERELWQDDDSSP